MSTYLERVIGAAKLDAATYEEVEADNNATAQAAGVVAVSSLAAGIGSAALPGSGPGIVIGTLAALLGWVIWASLTWAIGTKLLPGERTEADIGQMLRTIGFASAAGVLRLGGIIPGLGWLFILVGSIWMLVATVVAVRQALDYQSTWRAFGVCLIGWLILGLLQVLLFAPAAPPPAGGA